MKSLIYANMICEVEVKEDFRFVSKVKCSYNKATIAYAVERFLSKTDHGSFNPLFSSWAHESWMLRLAKGKARRAHYFCEVFPAEAFELPGRYVRLSGVINAYGIKVHKVELLRECPLSDAASAVHNCRRNPQTAA